MKEGKKQGVAALSKSFGHLLFDGREYNWVTSFYTEKLFADSMALCPLNVINYNKANELW